MMLKWTVITAMVVGWSLIIRGFVRKGRVATAKLGSQPKQFFVSADIDSAFRAIAAIDRPFRVDDSDAAKKVLVLSSGIALVTCGFIYPVFLHAAGSGTRIEVGCHNKVPGEVSAMKAKWHADCEAAIRAALTIPTARVA